MIIGKLKEEIKQLFIQSIHRGFSIETMEIEVTRNKKEGYGDFTSTVAFSLNKLLKKKPIEIATIIEKEWNSIPSTPKIVVVPPGFINIYLSEDEKIKLLEEIQKEDFKYLKNKTNFSPIREELDYIAYRTKWVLEVFDDEGVIPKISSLKREHIKYPVEAVLLNQLVDWVDIIEEAQQDEGKVVQLLNDMVENFHKYHNSLKLRSLEDPHRNLVLNLFKALNNIFQ